MNRSFGIEATDDQQLLTTISHSVQTLGYERLWFNDTPAADGLSSLSIALDAEPSLKAGVGVVGADRRTPEEVAGSIHGSFLNRVTIGVGAGFTSKPTDAVDEWLRSFRQAVPDVEIAVAAMGPKMCYFASRSADVVLLNWMTPDRVRWAREQMADGSKARVAAYVRVAVGEDAEARLRQASVLYAGLPHYARHFAAMGGDPGKIGIGAPSERVAELLVQYDAVLDETIVRAVGIPGDVRSVIEIAEAAAP